MEMNQLLVKEKGCFIVVARFILMKVCLGMILVKSHGFFSRNGAYFSFLSFYLIEVTFFHYFKFLHYFFILPLYYKLFPSSVNQYCFLSLEVFTLLLFTYTSNTNFPATSLTASYFLSWLSWVILWSHHFLNLHN
jgi:riboflavin transporter FmnP